MLFRQIHTNLRSSIIFNFLAFILLILSILIFNRYLTVKEEIVSVNNQANLEYVQEISHNINEKLKKELQSDFYAKLAKEPYLRTFLEDEFRLFLTKKYKYIYLVDKADRHSDSFRFLLDASVIEKSEFGESYTPLTVEKWNNAYLHKTPMYFQNTDVQGLWITYLSPIVINNNVEAILVIDFSLHEQAFITSSLEKLGDIFEIALVFIIIIFFIIILFSRLDYIREKEKQKAYQQLKEESEKVHTLNHTLEEKIAQAIKETEKKEKLLQQQTRLAQMGEMISMIAHQWRQPLSAISSAVLSIQTKQASKKFNLEVTQERNQFLHFIDTKHTRISEYVQVLSNTIDDFRNFFKPDKNRELVTLTTPIQRALSIVQISMNSKNIQITTEFLDDTSIYMYQNEIMQVILNILKNAEDNFIEKDIKKPIIKIRTKKSDTTYIIFICDNGRGIPEDIITHIFDPYFSTKDEKNGTGLGLYMSKIMIEEHNNGKLSVINDKNGACFKISLKSYTK